MVVGVREIGVAYGCCRKEARRGWGAAVGSGNQETEVRMRRIAGLGDHMMTDVGKTFATAVERRGVQSGLLVADQTRACKALASVPSELAAEVEGEGTLIARSACRPSANRLVVQGSSRARTASAEGQEVLGNRIAAGCSAYFDETLEGRRHTG